MASKVTNLPIPDLRFEQTFLRSLRAQATSSSQPTPLTKSQLERQNAADIRNLNQSIDEQEQLEIDAPLPPITPGIVTYVIIRDQVIMPLLQGLVFTGAMMLFRPFLRQIVLHGQRMGSHLAAMLGLNQILR